MTNLIIVTDPGKCLDDENTLILAGQLQRLKLINLLAVVAVLTPSKKRALLAKGTLKQVGLGHVPVGQGSDCGVPDTGESDHEFAGITYLADESEISDGMALLVSTLERKDVADKSVTLLLIAGQTDPAALLRNHEALFLQKVQRVVIMGGVVQKDDHIFINDEGFMEPDKASNNEFDPEAAKFLYRRLQELNIALTVLSREAAYACPVPRNHYDHMVETGNAVGLKLHDFQKRLIEAVWRRANYPADDVRRERLPNRCDRNWFLNAFCGGKGAERKAEDSIWDLILQFFLYDPMTLVAAVPDLRDKFFAPEIAKVGTAQHEVIGLSAKNRGVKDGQGVVDFLCENIVAGLETATSETEAA